MNAPIPLDREDLVRKLIELATMHLSMRESFALAKAALKDPDRTARLLNLRFKGQTLTEAEMVDLLRSLKRELETMGAA